MRVRLRPGAKDDLAGIYRFIAKDNIDAARSFSAALKSQVARLALHPEAYRLRPELGEEVRACPFGRYLILYVIDGETLRVLRVVHSAMDIANPPGS
jgi:toxin ParE1/3/4